MGVAGEAVGGVLVIGLGACDGPGRVRDECAECSCALMKRPRTCPVQVRVVLRQRFGRCRGDAVRNGRLTVGGGDVGGHAKKSDARLSRGQSVAW